MAKGIKTKETEQDVDSYIDAIENEQKRKDCKELLKMIKKISGYDPKVWGNGTVGFGTYHYKYPTGQEGVWYVTEFAPRKQNISIQVMSIQKDTEKKLKKLGKAKAGVGCLYIKTLSEVDVKYLGELIRESITFCKKHFGKNL